jgi:hypothetical protein
MLILQLHLSVRRILLCWRGTCALHVFGGGVPSRPARTGYGMVRRSLPGILIDPLFDRMSLSSSKRTLLMTSSPECSELSLLKVLSVHTQHST